MDALPNLKPRYFIVPIDGVPVRVYTDGSLPTPRDVEAIREALRSLRAERGILAEGTA
jgi:hypothetical protein